VDVAPASLRCAGLRSAVAALLAVFLIEVGQLDRSGKRTVKAMRVGWHISREPQDCDGAENLPRLVGGLFLRLGPDATHISRARSNPTFDL
jgi:hypothetical protein